MKLEPENIKEPFILEEKKPRIEGLTEEEINQWIEKFDKIIWQTILDKENDDIFHHSV